MAKKIDDIEEKKILESFRKAAENDRRVYNNLSLDLKLKRGSEVEKNTNYYYVTYDYEDIVRIIPKIMETVATYTDPQGNVCQDSMAVRRCWGKIQIHSEMQHETILSVVNVLKTYKDKDGTIRQASDNIDALCAASHNLWYDSSIWKDRDKYEIIRKDLIVRVVDLLSTYVGKDGVVHEGTDNIKSLLRNLDDAEHTEIRDNKFLDILNYFVSTTYENEYHKQCSQIENLNWFLEKTPKAIIEKYYEDICKIALEFAKKGNGDISRILLLFLPEFKDLSETNKRKIIESNLILKADLKDFEQIRGFITKDTPVYLEVRNASEMQLQQIEKLESEGINLQYVGLEPEGEEACVRAQTFPYNIEEYKLIINKLNTLLEEVDTEGDETKICIQILHAISRFMIYDESAIAEDKGEKIVSRQCMRALLCGMGVCTAFQDVFRNMAVRVYNQI